MLRTNSENNARLLPDSKGLTSLYQINGENFETEIRNIYDTKSIFVYEKRKSFSFNQESYLELDILREINDIIKRAEDNRYCGYRYY